MKAKPDPKARNPVFDPVARATPADILLVVVGGEPLYGDPDLMKQLRPGATLDDIPMCGVQKKLFLGESDALKEGFDKIRDVLNAALMKAGSKLPEIECE